MIRKVVRCDGEQVSGDPGRVWYAIMEQAAPNAWHVAVYHPKDSPPDSPQATCACISESDCKAFLLEEGWVRHAAGFDYLPADYLPPSLSPALLDVLRSARTNLRDLHMDWPEGELHEPVEATIGRITEILGDGYDIESGKVASEL